MCAQIIDMDDVQNSSTIQPLKLNDKQIEQLEKQNTRLVSEFKAQELEKHAKKHWDLFYKRNETRFFKDRHWTTREFLDLAIDSERCRTLWEVGCGVGNFIFPLIEEKLNFQYVASDLSSKAVELLKTHPLYDAELINAFQADVTASSILDSVAPASVDIATLIFVLSAIHPNKFKAALSNIYECLKPGGFLLFRDYGLFDMAQLRFKPGHKIADNFYMRQDGTRSYYFSVESMDEMMKDAGFKCLGTEYIHRRTVNVKENVDVPRVYVQGKFEKN